MRFKLNESRVAHQEVDGEVIAVDFANGAYFSMRGTAAAIWRMLIEGAEPAAIAALYHEHASADAEIEAFSAELVAAGLLLPDEAAPRRPAAVSDVLEAYSAPRLEKFEDMADLIMIDPVHDVSEAGWPHLEGRAP